jgi:hypothetical protein
VDWSAGLKREFPLDLSVTDANVGVLVERLSSATGVPVAASHEVAVVAVTLHFQTATLGEALARIAEEAGCEVIVNAAGIRLERRGR